MRRTVLYISMSLDGCLVRPDGDVSWLAGQDPDDPDPGTYPAFLSTVDTVVMGWTTYHQVVTQLSPGSWPYRGLDCYVLTHRPLPPQTEKIQAFSGPAHQLVEQLKREPAGRDIWICGGADSRAAFYKGTAERDRRKRNTACLCHSACGAWNVPSCEGGRCHRTSYAL